MRIESKRQCEKGGWLHKKDCDQEYSPLPKKTRRKTDEELNIRWAPIAKMAASHSGKKLDELAEKIGVDSNALFRLNVGYSESLGDPCWTFPERNADGLTVGITRRIITPKNGRSKLFCKGSRRGIIYSDDWMRNPGVVWLVEGASDVAAGITLGICVVGRPNNIGGTGYLAKLLRNCRRSIIVLGENDRKNDLYISQAYPTHDRACGACALCWPGMYGMQETAHALTRLLKRPVGQVMPPDGYKDLREIVKSLAKDERKAYASHMQKGELPSPDKYRTEEDTGGRGLEQRKDGA